jgi:flagellar hook-associated protein 1 FlgK
VGLNKEIAQQEFDEGGTANDLRDLREQKLVELANYVKFDTSEDSNGELNISINGNLLVSGANLVDTLQTYVGGNNNLLVRLAGSLTQVPSTGGSIQGAIDTRDQNLVAVKLNIDTIAKQLIDEVNAVHTNGFGLNGTTGEDFFTGTDAATIKVNTILVDNPSLVQLSDAADTPTSNTIANELFKLSSKKLTGLNT